MYNKDNKLYDDAEVKFKFYKELQEKLNTTLIILLLCFFFAFVLPRPAYGHFSYSFLHANFATVNYNWTTGIVVSLALLKTHLHHLLRLIKGRIGALETQSEQQAAEIAEIRADIVRLKKTVNSVPASAPTSVLPSLLPSPASSHLSDPREILLTGLPTDANLTDREALDRVFTTIGLKDYSKFLVHT
uniref:RRM domain-containing protein n=1 Tax=Trichogramma kaykai TaxID=54128 RepID=A0ABD2WA74_9HYME